MEDHRSSRAHSNVPKSFPTTPSLAATVLSQPLPPGSSSTRTIGFATLSMITRSMVSMVSLSELGYDSRTFFRIIHMNRDRNSFMVPSASSSSATEPEGTRVFELGTELVPQPQKQDLQRQFFIKAMSLVRLDLEVILRQGFGCFEVGFKIDHFRL
ncbi:hypothetical protein AHAS_Ahas13G0505600 [Arachis hypogaea]